MKYTKITEIMMKILKGLRNVSVTTITRSVLDKEDMKP